jgi:hypothetical protein
MLSFYICITWQYLTILHQKSQFMSQPDSRVIDAATVCLLYAVRIDNVRADALVNTLEARGLLRLLIGAIKSGADHSDAAGGSFQSSLLVVRRIATSRDSLYSLFAAALEREHSAATRMLDPLAPQDESEDALNEDDEFLWPLTDRVVSLVEVLAAAFDVWFTDGTPSTPALTLIPLRSVACLGSMLRSVRRRLMVLAFGSTTSDSSLERGARFCAQLCALVAAAAADGAEWQEAMTRAPDVCDSIIELLRVVAHVEARVPGANFAHIKRELLRALANLLSNHSVMLADHIAAVGGVELLLNSTRVIDSNPYASQWAILALRYACEVSAPVRDVIVGLRREGVVPSDGSAVQVQVQDDGSIKLSTPARDENCND